jgi:xylulokinase
MSRRAGQLTVGVDVGTTSVKAAVVDADGAVLARARVPHPILTPEADRLEHDARRAWHQGPRRAFAAVTAEVSVPIAGLAVAAMVPSLTAVDRRGVPIIPGLLYGDARGREEVDGGPADSPMPDAEGFLRWALAEAPGAAGYWPAQAVATHALSGVPAVDSATTGSFGGLYAGGEWNRAMLDHLGVADAQLPVVVPMCQAGGTLPGTDTVFTGGSIDALCDQVVSGASEPGDVLAIFGATLVTWIVTDRWVEAPGLFTVPHTVPDRVLIGGPSNAGALFVDWARRLLRLPGPSRPAAGGGSGGDVPCRGEELRRGDPRRVPVWLPYLRGERSPFNDPMLRASVHGLDITQGPSAIERAAYEASGFVIRRLLDRAGVTGRRVVASGGGARVGPWMAGVADATGLPVDCVAVPEGAALGAAFFARLAAGLERSLADAGRWARTGRRIEPDLQWSGPAAERYQQFTELGPGT